MSRLVRRTRGERRPVQMLQLLLRASWRSGFHFLRNPLWFPDLLGGTSSLTEKHVASKYSNMLNILSFVPVSSSSSDFSLLGLVYDLLHTLLLKKNVGFTRVPVCHPSPLVSGLEPHANPQGTLSCCSLDSYERVSVHPQVPGHLSTTRRACSDQALFRMDSLTQRLYTLVGKEEPVIMRKCRKIPRELFKTLNQGHLGSTVR